jgi:peptidoglycan hydrolase-like protein with peptidoglycan-binding domain
MQRKNIFFFLFVLLVSFCSAGDETTIESTVLQTSTTTSTTLLETTTTTSTTSTVPDGCIPEDNTKIDFSDLKNVQNFLNRYGFNAGEEDGLNGNQTIEAVKEFQAYAGLIVDGDLGPNTYSAMNTWTGCETRISTYTPQVSTTTTTTTQPNNTTTTTVSTTTTTIVVENINNNFGYQSLVQPETGELISIISSKQQDSNFCSGTFSYADNQKFKEDLGFTEIYNLYQSLPQLNTNATVQIYEDNQSTFTIRVTGNGDKNYRYYFIEPFTSNFVSIQPTNVTTSTGTTTAVFTKTNLTAGYWFFTHVDNGTGSIIKSSGPREFIVGNPSNQTVSNLDVLHNLWLHNSSGLVRNGSFLENGTNFYLTYVTDSGFSTYSNLSSNVNSSTNKLFLASAEKYSQGSVLLVGNELMIVKEKKSNELVVERGYRQSIIQSHNEGAPVKQIVTSQNMRATRGYAVFQGEKGYKFSVSLGEEGKPTNIKIGDNCPKDLYKLSSITLFSWREQGESAIRSYEYTNHSSLSDDSFTLYQGIDNYKVPTLSSIDTTSNTFLNTGPREQELFTGDSISFDFAGISKGSSEINFVELEFYMNPLGSKKSKTRKVIFTPENNFKFTDLINNITNDTAFTNGSWEKGYKYYLKSLRIVDGVVDILYKANGEVLNITTNSKSKHDVYYLDQFSFIISE